MKRYTILFVILFFLIVGYFLFQRQWNVKQQPSLIQKKQQLLFQGLPSPVGNQPATPSASLQVVASGINRPYGVGFINNTLYVSSLGDKTIYTVSSSEKKPIAKMDFVNSFLTTQDSLLLPDYANNTIMKVASTSATVFKKGLSGPLSISKDKKNNYYVANYLGNTVTLFQENGNSIQNYVTNLAGPSSVLYDDQTSSLYIANFLSSTLTIVVPGNRADITYKSLLNMTTLYLSSKQRLYVLATNNGHGVLAELKQDGTALPILITDLPSPVVGYFANNTVYMVSPNDKQGRILKGTF